MDLLRSILGPAKDEIWSQIARDIGGEFIEGGFGGKDVLVYRHSESNASGANRLGIRK